VQQLERLGRSGAALGYGDGNLFWPGGAAGDEDTIDMGFHRPHLGMGDLKEPVRTPG